MVGTREDAKRAHDKQRIRHASPFYQCWLPKQLQYKIVVPRQQYESQLKKQWDALGEKKGPDDPYVQTRIGDRGDIFIEIVGKEKKAAGPSKCAWRTWLGVTNSIPRFGIPRSSRQEVRHSLIEYMRKQRCSSGATLKPNLLKFTENRRWLGGGGSSNDQSRG
jgi:hypothetical protein